MRPPPLAYGRAADWTLMASADQQTIAAWNGWLTNAPPETSKALKPERSLIQLWTLPRERNDRRGRCLAIDRAWSRDPGTRPYVSIGHNSIKAAIVHICAREVRAALDQAVGSDDGNPSRRCQWTYHHKMERNPCSQRAEPISGLHVDLRRGRAAGGEHESSHTERHCRCLGRQRWRGTRMKTRRW